MRAVAASGQVCGAGRSSVEGRDDERDRKPLVKVNLLAARPGESSRLAVAARLEGLGGFGRRGRRRGCWLLFCAIGTGAAVCGFDRSLLRAGGRDREKTTPSLRKGQEEGVAECQRSQQQAHILFYVGSGKKVHRNTTEQGRRTPPALRRDVSPHGGGGSGVESPD